MQKDLIQKQVGLINQLLMNQVIEDSYIFDSYTHVLAFPGKQFLFICQKAPHIGLCFIKDEIKCQHFASMAHEVDLVFKNGIFKGLRFSEENRVLTLYLEDKQILFEMRACGKKQVIKGKVLHDLTSAPIELDDQEDLVLQKYKQDLCGYIFKNVTAYFLKLQKQVASFKNELEMLPAILEKQQEGLLFILEHQTQIFSKDQHFLDTFKKYDINYLLPYGTILKKAYKKIHKLETQKQILPKLIALYEKKLEAPYKAPIIKTEFEKKEHKQSRVFFTSHKEKIRVARSDKDADILTFKEAYGHYYWFHVDQYPGAHTVIFSSQPTQEALETARFLAKYYSKAKDKPECDVIQTQVKFLKKGKKKGEVYVLQKQIVRVKQDSDLEKKIFANLI